MSNKKPHCRKAGPGRTHQQGDGAYKKSKAGSYGRGLINHFTRNQLAAINARKAVARGAA